jgi:N-acetyltransferase 10
LLLELGERPPERLHYIGTSFGLTANLLRFWKKAGFTPTYLRQTANDLTGEHTTIMLKILDHDSSSAWLPAYWTDFRRRLLSLLGYQLRSLAPSLALSLLQNKSTKLPSTLISSSQLSAHLTHYDVARLELYSNNMADYHLVTDLLPPLARLVFTQQLGDLHLSAVQQALLTGLGLQHKTVDDLATELELPASQLLGLFNRCVRKLSTTLKQVLEGGIEQQIKSAQLENGGDKLGAPLPDLGTELQEVVEELETKQKKTKEKNKEIFMSQDLSQYAIKGSDKEWGKALGDTKKGKNVISVKTGEKRTSEMTADPKDLENLEPGKKKKKKKNKEKH